MKGTENSYRDNNYISLQNAVIERLLAQHRSVKGLALRWHLGHRIAIYVKEQDTQTGSKYNFEYQI